MKISDLTEEEKLYASKQSQQLRGDCGEVQCTNIVFNKNRLLLSNNEYYNPFDKEAFENSFNKTIEFLKDEGFMKSKKDIIEYGKTHYDGVRIDNEGYTYITTFNPDGASATMYIYKTDRLDYHIEEAKRGIKVRCGDNSFTIKDGEKIAIDYKDGNEPVIRTVRYIDPTHFELDGSSLSLFHRDEFNMIMETNGYDVKPYDKSEKMTVVLIRPEEEAEITKIGSKLEDMQKVVGGYIEAFYYDPKDEVCLICNEEGKLLPLKPNRAIYDEDNNLHDIIYGTCFVVGLGEEEFCSLSKEQAKEALERFKCPERFFFYKEELICEKMIPKEKKTKGLHI